MSSRKNSTVRRAKSGRRVDVNLKGAGTGTGNWRWWRVCGLLAVILTSLVLNCVGLGWGRSGLVPWQPDSIEGITTVRENQRMFGQWTYKYPRGHFLINAIFYQPLLEHWEKNPIRTTTADGRIVSQTLNLQRLDVLAKISRIISVVMGTGTVFAVFLTAMLLFKDYLAALLAALTLALSQLFVFYSHIGNVDVPYIFWLTWSVYWAVKAVYIGKWRHFILLGLFCSYSVCTKEPAGTYVTGLGIAIWIAITHRVLKEGGNLKEALLSVFSLKTLGTVFAFGLCFVVLNGFLAGPEEFFNRMQYWGNTQNSFNESYQGFVSLLSQSGKQLYQSIGWPLLIMYVVSVVYFAIKDRLKLAFVVSPLLVFCFFTIVKIHFVAPRFFLAGYPGLSLLVGKTCADWLRCKKTHIALRVIPIALVYILSLLYCIGLDLEMLNDTRVRTEQWFYKNVGRDKIIGAGIYNKIYAPRLHLNRYRLICPWRSSSLRETPGQSVLYPDYLIITSKWRCTNEETEHEFRKKLFSGQLDYELVASFKPKYLYPARTIFGFAGWPISKNHFLSSEIRVFKKKVKGAGESEKYPGGA